MADVLSTITYTIVDGKGKKSSMQVTVKHPDDNADPAASPIQYAASLAELLDPLITGRIAAINVTSRVALPGTLKTMAELNSDVEEGAKFIFRTAGGFTLPMRVPTFDEALTLPDGTVDITVSVSDFSAMLTQPEELPANWVIDPCDSRGDSIAARTAAREDFRRS
jgi:hypothetical protein